MKGNKCVYAKAPAIHFCQEEIEDCHNCEIYKKRMKSAGAIKPGKG